MSDRAVPQDVSIAYTHHLLNVTSLDAHKRFWIDALGGKPVAVDTCARDAVAFSGVFIFLREQAPSGGTKGTVINHFGLQVPNVRATIDRLRAVGYPISTRTEVSAANAKNVKDDLAFVADQNTYIAYVTGPDSTKLELVENKALSVPVALHHIHFFTPAVADMKAWYADVFGAIPGKRGSFEAADLPGANLTFSATSEPVVGTRGRLLDHIGLEVKRLEAFCHRLEAAGHRLDQPYTASSAHRGGRAFITDPWGTYIELTEGLVSASAMA